MLYLDTMQALHSDGFAVFENAIIDDPAMVAACEALVEWHSTHDVVSKDRYCHAPEFVATGALNELSEKLCGVVLPIFGKDNAKGRPLQLLGSIGGKATEPRHKDRHIDNVPNCVDEAEKRAVEKGIAPKEEPVLFPNFNAIACLALTETWVTVWPESHNIVAAFFKAHMACLVGNGRSEMEVARLLLTVVNDRLVKPYPKPEKILKLERGDVLIMNHLLMHAACDPGKMLNPSYIVPGKGELSARLYQRFQTLSPPPEGTEAMQTPWHGCHGMHSC